MKNLKKKLIILLTLVILMEVFSGNYVRGVKIQAMTGNNQHFQVEQSSNVVKLQESVNVLAINKYAQGDNVKKQDELEVVSREDELLELGYEIIYENNTDTELFFYNEETGDIKIIQYFEPTLVLGDDGLYRPFEAKVKMSRNGDIVIEQINFTVTIDENRPLLYTQDGIEFAYYLEGEVLQRASFTDNTVTYTSTNGLELTFSVGSNSLNINTVVTSNDITQSNEVLIIKNNYNFINENGIIYVKGDENEVRFSSTDNSELIAHASTMETEIAQEEPLSMFYELNEETKMLLTKRSFNMSVMETFTEDVKLIINYQSIKVSAPTGERYFRGIRSHESSAIYPYGVDAAPGINNNYGVDDNYIRIGARNFSKETGFENMHINSMGFFEDRVDYKNYFDSYHEGKQVIDNGTRRDMLPVVIDSAALSISPVEIGGKSSLGDYLKTYYPSQYESVKSNTVSGSGNINYTLSIIEGSGLDPRSLTFDNYHNNIANLNTTPASGNVLVGADTFINMDTVAGTPHKFDITNAISKWSREGYTGPQVIRIQNDSWDIYINKNAYVELSVREMPNFAENDIKLSDTTVNLRSFASNDQKGSVTTQGISIDGLTSYQAIVTYEIYDVKTDEVIHSNTTTKLARETYAYPYYDHKIDKAQNYYRLESNYQSEEIIPITKFSFDKVYGVRVKATEGNDSSEWIEGDKFQVYQVGYKFETFNRILNFYGRSSEELNAESKIDNNMINPVISEKNTIFIRNPKKNAGKKYVASDLSDADKWLIDGALMGMNLKCEYGFEPINFNNGNFFYNITDGVIYNGQVRIDIKRYYNSKKGGVDSAFGRNWTSVFDAKLQILENGSIAFEDPTGRVHTMTKNEDESYNSSYGEGYTFELVVVGEYSQEIDNDYYIPAFNMSRNAKIFTTEKYNYVVTTNSGVKYYFNDLMQLIRIQEKNGSSFEFEHNTVGVSKIISDTDKTIIVQYNESGYISKLTYPNGSTSVYEYDEVGNLISYADGEEHVVEYKYEDKNDEYLMTSYNMKGEESLIINTYDTEKRITKQVDANNNVSMLTYFDDHTVVKDAEGNTREIYFNELGFTTKVINNGEVTEYKLDSYGNVTQQLRYNSDGENVVATTFEYNENKVVKATDKFGEDTNYQYDSNNNVTSIDNGEYVTTLKYDSNNNLIMSSNSVSGTITYEYNKEGYLTKTTNAFGGVTENVYNSDMHIEKKITPTGETRYTYNENGSLISKTNEFGGTYAYVRNLRGEIVETTDPFGNKEHFEFNSMGHLIAKQDLNGNIVNYKYDSIGNLIEEIDAYGTKKYKYDSVYNMIESTDANGNVTKYEYNSKNYITKVIYPNGNEIEYKYDEFGNVVEQRDSVGVISKTQYNELNLIAKVEEANGKSVEYVYDAEGRVIKVQENNVVTTTNVYNDYGQLSTTYNARALKVDYEYSNNKIIKSTVGDEIINSNSYGNNGLITSNTDSYNNSNKTEYTYENKVLKYVDKDGVETEYKYDVVGRVVEVIIGGEVQAKTEYYPLGQVKKSFDGNGNMTEYVIDYAGRISSHIDAKGNITSYEYDANGNMVKVIDPYKNVTTYKYDNMNNVVSITDAINREISYNYNYRGQVTSTVYPDNTIETVEYNHANQVVLAIGRDGVKTTYEYDNFGRVVKESDSTGRSLTVSYDVSGNIISQTNHGKQTTEFQYDNYGRKVKEISYDGNQTISIYDKESRVIESIDPLGNSTYKSYTAQGRVDTDTSITGGVTKYEYDEMGRNNKVINPLDEVTTMKYDKNSNIVEQTDARGMTTAYEYDELNRMIKQTSALGITTSSEYDANGNVIIQVDGRGNKTSYNYDEVGRNIESVDALGFVSKTEYDVVDNVVKTIDQNNIETEYEFDVNGNVTKVKYDTGATINKKYDSRNNLVHESDRNGNVTKYSYDELDRLTTTKHANGNVTQKIYNEVGDVVVEKDSVGVIAKYEYNSVHNVTREEDALGRETIYEYCNCGGLVQQMTDSNGNTINYEYDILNRMSKQIDERGVETTFGYDEMGNTTSLVINNQKVFTYEYDGDNRLIKDINPLNEINSYKYDENNNQIETTNGLGNTVTYEYDELNRNTKIIDAEGNATSYQYDALNLVMETDAANNSTKYEYDELGNIIRVENAKEEVTQYAYDDNGNLTYVTMNMRIVQTNIYDESDNLIHNKDTTDIATAYDYDIRNNQSKVIANDGRSIINKYNELNQLISQLSEDVEISNEYDEFGRLTQASDNGDITAIKYNNFNDIIEYVDENGNTIKYTYDEFGNKTSVTYSDGRVVKYEYDKLDRLIKIVDVDGNTSTYQYDAAGNRIAEQLPNNIQVRNEYNKNNQVTQREYYKDNKITLRLSYSYTPTGQVQREVKEEYSEDESEVALKTTKDYEYDELEQLVQATYNITKGDSKEKIVYEYSYNVWNDRQEVRITTNGEVEVITEETNSSGQIIKREGSDFTTVYEYDDLGNIIKETRDDGTSLTYEYNGLNQLVAIHSSSGYYEVYEYDGLGNRVEKQTYTPYNVYDTNGFSSNKTLKDELQQLIDEERSHKDTKNNTSSLREELQEDVNCDNIKEDTLLDKKVIQYVNDVNTQYARVLEVRGGDYQRNVFDDRYAVQTNGAVNILDQKGSVVGTVEKQLETRDYTPQGASLNTRLITSGNNSDKIGYSNEMHNNFNLQYLRARYYNQDNARFISQDTYKGEVGNPVTHNLYTYVENNAVNNTDPSGNMVDDGNGNSYDPVTDTYYPKTGVYEKNYVKNYTTGKYLKEAKDALKSDYDITYDQPSGMTDAEYYTYIINLRKYCDNLSSAGVNDGGIREFANIVAEAVELNSVNKEYYITDVIDSVFQNVLVYESDIQNRVLSAHEKYGTQHRNESYSDGAMYLEPGERQSQMPDYLSKNDLQYIFGLSYLNMMNAGNEKPKSGCKEWKYTAKGELAGCKVEYSSKAIDEWYGNAGETGDFVRKYENTENAKQLILIAAAFLSLQFSVAYVGKTLLLAESLLTLGVSATNVGLDYSLHGNLSAEVLIDETIKAGNSVLLGYELSKINLASIFKSADEVVDIGYDFGKSGKYVNHPGTKIDWDKLATHAPNRFTERGMSISMADDIVSNGKALSQSNGAKHMFVTKEGVVVVATDGTPVTGWTSANFDDVMKEIVLKLWGE